MVESALAMLAIIPCITFLFDTGMLLYKYGLLTGATNAVTRAVATSLGQKQMATNDRGGCSDLVNIAEAELVKMKGIKEPLFSSEQKYFLTIREASSMPYQLVSLTGKFTFSCFFCQFFKESIPPIEYTSVLTIERSKAHSVCPEGSPEQEISPD